MFQELAFGNGTTLKTPFDVFRAYKKHEVDPEEIKVSDVGIPKSDIHGESQVLDFNIWLPFAAKHMNISKDIKDYILVPVIIMPSDLPNRNGVGFPLSELVKFNPEMGMQAYKTWKGKPTYYEHSNKDLLQAKGVIVDTYMRKFQGFGGGVIWKLVALLAFDRSKDPELCRRILLPEGNAERLNTYSMGAYVGKYTCSVCGRDKGKCTHLSTTSKVNFHMVEDMLAYCLAMDIIGFETSAVETPAYTVAISDTVMPIHV